MDELALAAIVAKFKIDVGPFTFPPGCIVAVGIIEVIIDHPGSRGSLVYWKMENSRWGIRLAEITKIDPPIACRGWQRVWNLPFGVEELLGELMI